MHAKRCLAKIPMDHGQTKDVRSPLDPLQLCPSRVLASTFNVLISL